VNLSCGTEEETSVHVLSVCACMRACARERASACRRHAYLSSFFLDPKDIANLSMGAIWNFGKRTGLL
jgi:hypothetical protein